MMTRPPLTHFISPSKCGSTHYDPTPFRVLGRVSRWFSVSSLSTLGRPPPGSINVSSHSTETLESLESGLSGSSFGRPQGDHLSAFISPVPSGQSGEIPVTPPARRRIRTARRVDDARALQGEGAPEGRVGRSRWGVEGMDGREDTPVRDDPHAPPPVPQDPV